MSIHKTLKQLYLTLAILTISSLFLLIGAFVYQGISNLLGTGLTSTQVAQTSCKTQSINTKLSRSNILEFIGFIGGLLSAFCMGVMQIVIFYLWCKTKPEKRGNSDNESQLYSDYSILDTDKQRTEGVYKKMVAGYLIYSLGLLGNIMHAGSMLNIFLCNYQCKGDNKINVAMLVIAGLSGLAILCQLGCWVLWQVVRWKVHALMDGKGETEVELEAEVEVEAEVKEGKVQGGYQQVEMTQTPKVVDDRFYQTIVAAPNSNTNREAVVVDSKKKEQQHKMLKEPLLNKQAEQPIVQNKEIQKDESLKAGINSQPNKSEIVKTTPIQTKQLQPGHSQPGRSKQQRKEVPQRNQPLQSQVPVQNQPLQNQPLQGQVPAQNQPLQNQPLQGQVPAQNQPLQNQPLQGQVPAQNQPLQGQVPAQNQPLQGQVPAQNQPLQNQPLQGQVPAQNQPLQNQPLQGQVPAQNQPLQGQVPAQNQPLQGQVPAQNQPLQNQPLQGQVPAQNQPLQGQVPAQNQPLQGQVPAQNQPLQGQVPAQNQPLQGQVPAQNQPLQNQPLQGQVPAQNQPLQNQPLQGQVPAQNQHLQQPLSTQIPQSSQFQPLYTHTTPPFQPQTHQPIHNNSIQQNPTQPNQSNFFILQPKPNLPHSHSQIIQPKSTHAPSPIPPAQALQISLQNPQYSSYSYYNPTPAIPPSPLSYRQQVPVQNYNTFNPHQNQPHLPPVGYIQKNNYQIKPQPQPTIPNPKKFLEQQQSFLADKPLARKVTNRIPPQISSISKVSTHTLKKQYDNTLLEDDSYLLSGLDDDKSVSQYYRNVKNQIKGENNQKQYYIDYFKEQNQSTNRLFKPAESYPESHPSHPYFLSPKKTQKLKKPPSLHKSPILRSTISQKKLQEQQKKFYDSNNSYSSVLRSSFKQGDSSGSSQLKNLHKNVPKQFSKEPESSQRYYYKKNPVKSRIVKNSKSKQKNISLIDLIRSKYPA